MSRASLARNAPLPARYRLRTPTPPRASESLVFVARGRRMRLQLRHHVGVRLAEPSAPSPETPTDPESSPIVHSSRVLRRAYTRMRPTVDDPTSRPVEDTGAAAEVPLVADSLEHLGSQDVGQRDDEVVNRETPSPSVLHGMFLPIKPIPSLLTIDVNRLI